MFQLVGSTTKNETTKHGLSSCHRFTLQYHLCYFRWVISIFPLPKSMNPDWF
jgi:hypothetical protein